MPVDRRKNRQTIDELLERIAHLEAINAELSYNEVFGCLTRKGLDIAMRNVDLTGHACIYWDLDHLGEKNALWGKHEVNIRIAAAFRTRSSDCATGQVWSGDEYAAFPRMENALGMATRLLEAFRAQEMSGTFIIAPVRPHEGFREVLQRADTICATQKAHNLRNTVFVVYEEV